MQENMEWQLCLVLMRSGIGNAVYGANGEHSSRFKPQRGQESRRLHCLTRDREYELVTKAYGIGESRRGEQKIKM